MDSEQEQLNQPTAGDRGGQRSSKAANGGPGPTVSPEPDDAHTLSSKEATQIFEQAGIPRSQRSIERYCESGKLDCIVDPDEKHWYASKKSVDLLIGQLKELQTRHQASEVVVPGPTTSANGGPGPTVSPQTEQEELSTHQGSAAEVQDLKDKVWNLELDNKVKDQLLLRAKEEKAEDRKDLLTFSHRIGKLETENQQLKLLAGGEQEKEVKPEIGETEVITKVSGELESLTKESEEEETKEPPVGADQKKKSWWK